MSKKENTITIDDARAIFHNSDVYNFTFDRRADFDEEEFISFYAKNYNSASLLEALFCFASDTLIKTDD